jgi:hypothetical protein
MVASASSWVWWLAQALAWAVSVVVALLLTRRLRRSCTPARTDRVGLFGSIAIAFAGVAVGAWLIGLSWWWVVDEAAFFATLSFRLFARPLR